MGVEAEACPQDGALLALINFIGGEIGRQQYRGGNEHCVIFHGGAFILPKFS